MGASPDQLRENADITRGNLSRDMNALANRVSPSAIAARRRAAMRGRVSNMRDAVMGTTQHAIGSARQMGQSVADSMSTTSGNVAGAIGNTASETPDFVTRKTQGSPLAAGVVAFGVGMVVSALLPSSEAEQQAATRLKESAEPALGQARAQAQGAVQEVAGNLKGAAQGAVEQVKSAAADAGARTTDAAKSAAAEVGAHAKDAASTTADEARSHAQDARDELS